jgi:hypothetical protein
VAAAVAARLRLRLGRGGVRAASAAAPGVGGGAPRARPTCGITFYVGRVLAGEVETRNALVAAGGSQPAALMRAIVARLRTQRHTVVECVGPAAAAAGLAAIGLARAELLRHHRQDIAVVLAPRSIPGRAAAAGGPTEVLQHRFIVLPCALGRPAELQLRADVTWPAAAPGPVAAAANAASAAASASAAAASAAAG